jgi:cellulose synthase (UDP-forming)
VTSPSSPLRDWLDRASVRVLLGVALALLVPFTLAEVPVAAQVLLSTVFVAVGYWIGARAPELRLGLAYLSTAVSLRYLWWRGSRTLDLHETQDLVVAYVLYAAEIYAFIVMLLGYFQTVVLHPRRPVPLPADPATWPSVDVFVPSYDESVDIVRRTLIGALAIEYPNRTIHLLDDGRRPHMRALAEELGVRYHVRPDNKHAKAGNINAALKVTDGDLVAIFDCDHVPVRSFLNVTVGCFTSNPKLALVQTPHHFYNPDPFERNLLAEGTMPPENAVFYHSVQLGNDFWNSVLFCGSCAVIRRSALEQVGGIAVETVTEDAHTSLRMLARGWESAYLDIPQAAGLATERYSIHVAQRIRWARGMTQILRLDNPLGMKGLTLPQRLNYLNAILHFQFGIPRIVFVLAPVSYLVFGMHPLAANPLEMVAFVVPHMVLAVNGGQSATRGMRQAFWAEVYEVALAPYTTVVTTLALFAPRHGTFNVTAKGAQLDKATFDWRSASPNLILLGFALAATLITPYRIWTQPQDVTTIVVTALFNVYNVLVLLAAVAVAVDRPQQRQSHRVRRAVPVQLWSGDGAFLLAEGVTRDITEEGVGLRFPGDTDVPPDVRVALWLPHGAWSLPMDVDVMSAWSGRDGVTVGARFRELDMPQRRALVEAMFSSPDSWVVRGQHGSILGAMWGVIAAPWRTLLATVRRRRGVAS